jgi:magnesium chelatase subunit D
MVSLLKNIIFPFSAIVGQTDVKKALILNAVNPSIGGVLIKGDKGTGKTTAVRALADLLPPIEVVKGCPYNCDPNDNDSLCDSCRSTDFETELKPMRVVELPLGSTEDRVVGSINIEKALKEGLKALEPGILADANRNILYVDEINLLDDNLVDVLLDAAAYGVNLVEREGISVAHPSRFMLVGTMNPQEGELRPQLSDRIGLHISVHTIVDLEERVKIMERREDFERDPAVFKQKFEPKQNEILNKIIKAREILKKVRISRGLMEIIAYLCMEMGVDGHRADIAILRTSKAIAAYNEMVEVDLNNVEEAALLVLGERFQNSSQNKNQISQMVQRAMDDLSKKKSEQENTEEQKTHEDDSKQDDDGNQTSTGESNEDNGPSNSSESEENNQTLEDEEQERPLGEPQRSEKEPEPQNDAGLDNADENVDMGKKLRSSDKEDETESCEEGLDIKKLLKIKGKSKKKLYGKRVDSTTSQGKYVKSKFPKDKNKDIAIDATLRAAAISSEGKINVKTEDLRQKVRKHGAKASIAVVVDISGSMYSEKKAVRVKDILNNVIEDAARNGDKVSVVGFKGKDALMIIPTTRRAVSFKEQIENLKLGGTTPLASGMKRGFELLKKEKFRDEYVPMMLILTDGMPNVAINKSPVEDAINLAGSLKENEIHTIIINFEQAVKYGRDMNMELAVASGGRYYDLEQLKSPGCAVSMILDHERKDL